MYFEERLSCWWTVFPGFCAFTIEIYEGIIGDVPDGNGAIGTLTNGDPFWLGDILPPGETLLLLPDYCDNW